MPLPLPFCLMLAACSLARTPVRVECAACALPNVCEDGVCVPPVSDAGVDAPRDDAGAPDGGVDAPAPVDVGADGGADAGHCGDGALSPGESDVDCGGECPPCTGCFSCDGDGDCTTGMCRMGRCAPALSRVDRGDGTLVDAYVREDGAVLLAHYAPASFHRSFDPRTAQVVDATGGAPAPAEFAPDPCLASGHLSLAQFDPSGRTVELQCGTDLLSAITVGSSAVFDSFALGDHGGVGTTGMPGWGNVSAHGVGGGGRTRWGVCGSRADLGVAGIGYCAGPSENTPTNNLVSFSSTRTAGYIACGGVDCSGPTCDQHVWVWLHP